MFFLNHYLKQSKILFWAIILNGFSLSPELWARVFYSLAWSSWPPPGPSSTSWCSPRTPSGWSPCSACTHKKHILKAEVKENVHYKYSVMWIEPARALNALILQRNRVENSKFLLCGVIGSTEPKFQ